jgi:hypothetical protein
MNQKNHAHLIKLVVLGFPALLALLASFGAVFVALSAAHPSLPIEVSVFSDRINVVFDVIHLGFGQFPLDTQNFLLFQSFQSISPESFSTYTQVIGLLFWILICLGLTLITDLSKWHFIIAIGASIFMFTLSGVNGLHIGGIGTNNGLVIVLLGLLLPAVVLHFFFANLGWLARLTILLLLGMGTYFGLILLAQVPAPTLLFGENFSLMGLAIAAIFLLYIGHGAISGFYFILAKLNKGVGLKISWHLSIFSFLYIGLLGLYFFRLMGDIDFGLPLPPEYFLFLVVAVLAFLENRRKMVHVKQPYGSRIVGEGLFLIGFAVTSLIWFKADLSANTSMLDFLKHTFIYSQIGFSLLFYLYLITNFMGIMNSGQAVERIIYVPPFFPYYHMRFGALLSLLILLIYGNGIVAVQFSTASTNLSADYYYATERPIEAAILYENAWERYRNNPKNLNAVAHIHLAQNQPTAAQQFLMRSFDEKPNVPDILLLATQLERSSKYAEALFYLEEGLRYFPSNTYLLNNLALLKSKTNAPTEALEQLSAMGKEKEVSLSNHIGLLALHGMTSANLNHKDFDQIGKINLMAYHNLEGKVANFSLAYDTIRQPTLMNQAILRNEWTQSVPDMGKTALALVDSLIHRESIPSREADWRETRLIGDYRHNNINQVIRASRSLAFNFKGSAGFYHSLEAKVLSDVRDFNQAGQAWLEALGNGYQNLRQEHLPIIYFGGFAEEALQVSEKSGVPMPSWMRFNDSQEIIPNDTVQYAQGLANLHPGLLDDLLDHLESISQEALKARFAMDLIRHKAHWMDEDTIEALGTLVIKELKDEGHKDQFREWLTYLQEGEFPGEELQGKYGKYFASKGKGNAYHAPLVMMAVAQAKEDLEKYELLQEATTLNKDPLLWIHMVKYSRLLGLDHYASRSLAQMGEWVPAEKLTLLQLDHF